MDEKKRTVFDQTIAGVGGVAGTAIATIAGADPIIGATVGCVGSVGALLAAKYAPEYFNNAPIRRYLNNRKIETLLTERINAELEHSFLESRDDAERAFDSMRDFLRMANAVDPSIGQLDPWLARNFQWNLAGGDIDVDGQARRLDRLAMHCRVNGPIRIGCPVVCCAFAAIIRDLHRQLSTQHGVDITVDCYEINGRTFFDSLQNNCDLDFAAGPLEALVLSDPDKKLPLRIIGPLFGKRQLVFVNTKRRVNFHSGVWVFDRSSAKLQYHTGIGIPRRAEEQPFKDARQITDLVEGIPAGDMIIAWDPISSVLIHHKSYVVVPQSEYTVHFVLMGHREVLRKNRFPVDDFLAVLLSEWRSRRHAQNRLLATLREDQRFMTAFAHGAGQSWITEL